MSLCTVHGHVHPEHDRYRLEFFYQSRIPCVSSRTGLFVVFSLFTSFCRDTSCQARPFCRENIVPLYNLGGSNPSRVNSRGIKQYFGHFPGVQMSEASTEKLSSSPLLWISTSRLPLWTVAMASVILQDSSHVMRSLTQRLLPFSNVDAC